MTRLSDHISVQFGYSDIFNSPYSINNIISEMSEYNVWSIAIIVAKVQLVTCKEDGLKPKEQIKLLASIFSPETRSKIHALLTKRGASQDDDDWVFFLEPPILELLNTAMLVCSEGTGKDLRREDLDKFGRWYLAFAEEWTRNAQPPMGLRFSKTKFPGSVYVDLSYKCHFNYRAVKYKGYKITNHSAYATERLRRHFAQNNFIMRKDNPLHRITRTVLILEASKNNKENLDIESLFLELTGYNVFDYLAFGFSLLPKWSIPSEDFDETKDTIRNYAYFEDSNINEDVMNGMLELLSTSPKQYPYEYKEIVHDVLKGKNRQNNFMVFMRHPILRADSGNFLCVSPNLLAERTSNGFYWIMQEKLNQIRDRRRLDKLSRAWGFGFESYINNRLSLGFESNYVKNFTFQDKELADGLILGKKALFIVETKLAQWPYVAKLDASKKNMSFLLKNIFGDRSSRKRKGLEQINHLANMLTSEDVIIDDYRIPEMIIPIIVTGEVMPTDILNRRYYKDFAITQGSYKHNGLIKPFILINFEEVEYLEDLAINNLEKCEELLIEYSTELGKLNGSGFAANVMSLKSFMVEKGFKLENTQSLRTEFDQIADRMQAYLFE